MISCSGAMTKTVKFFIAVQIYNVYLFVKMYLNTHISFQLLKIKMTRNKICYTKDALVMFYCHGWKLNLNKNMNTG